MDTIINNVSFVIVARNEEDRLSRCLDSICRFKMVNCEVICVDSSSTDRTLEIMMTYKERYSNFIVLAPSKCLNSATARNYGKNAAMKDVIFFVDGDIELNSQFLEAAFVELTNSDISAVIGGLDEIIYDDLTKKVVRGPYIRSSYSQKEKVKSCGGTVLVRRIVAAEIGDYDERFFRSQDLDYSLRLTTKHIMIALPIQMGTHHTGEYRERPYLHFINGYNLNQGMLARKHCNLPGFWTYWVRSRKLYLFGFLAVNTLLLLMALMLCGIISWLTFLVTIGLFLLMETAYSLYNKMPLSSILIISLLSPYMVLLGFLLEPFKGGAEHVPEESVVNGVEP